MEAADFYAWEESQLHPKLVTYLVELNGRLLMVENVPARVNQVTGERLFSLETADRLLQIAQGGSTAPTPLRVVKTPVYSFGG